MKIEVFRKTYWPIILNPLTIFFLSFIFAYHVVGKIIFGLISKSTGWAYFLIEACGNYNAEYPGSEIIEYYEIDHYVLIINSSIFFLLSILGVLFFGPKVFMRNFSVYSIFVFMSNVALILFFMFSNINQLPFVFADAKCDVQRVNGFFQSSMMLAALILLFWGLAIANRKLRKEGRNG